MRLARERNARELVWERDEPANRPAPSPLSRERILRAAVAIADSEGLGAVSLRKIAASLDAGPMRLYGYVSTKEELLDLMVDAVYGEFVSPGPDVGDWRTALKSSAHRVRLAAKKHVWFIDLFAGRPHLGPNALTFREQTHAALSNTPGFEDIDIVRQAVLTVHAYVVGAILSEVNALRAERESGMDRAEWQAASWSYIERILDTGRFPTLAKVAKDATHPPRDVVFDRGLDWVLDGIAARLPR